MFRVNNWLYCILCLGLVIVTPFARAASPSVGDPAKPGGEGTTRSDSADAFSFPAKNISIHDRVKFMVGKSFFRENWVATPASVKSLEGLGPTFIAQSCIACHDHDGRGRPPEDGKEEFRAVLFRLSVPGHGALGEPLGLPNYGDQLQNFAVSGVPVEGKPHVKWTEVSSTFDDGSPYSLAKPEYSFSDLAFGEFPKDVQVSPRVAPAVYGLGLLEAIAEKDILKNADPEDRDGDGIRGHANFVWDFKAKKKALGRFGLKANQPHLRQQVAGAFNGDMGITTSLFPKGNCPALQTACVAANTKQAPEILDRDFETVHAYVQLLSVPARRELPEEIRTRGDHLMKDLSCTKCHSPSFHTSSRAEFSANRNQWIYPYTDLLLHDMGPELADNRPDFEAGGQDWRTPPLWGLGLVPKVNRHTRLLHDGRARSVEEAILWHGGEGEVSRRKFKALNREDRGILVKFVESL